MKTTVTFIPGMFSPIVNTFLGTYFIDQMEYLEKRKVPYFMMPVHTEGSLDKNAAIIERNLESLESVTAFCHSKGGVDLLHALILKPHLRNKFKKIIFVQCPFFGTPLADLATQSNFRRMATKKFFQIAIRGEVESIAELSMCERERYMNKHASSIETLVKGMDIQCIGSAKLPERGRFDSILKIPRDFIQYKFDLPNDGMIPKKSALIPGTKYVTFDDLDHASAVIRFTPQIFDRAAFSHEMFAGGIG